MTRENEAINFPQKRIRSYMPLLIFGLLFFVLLLMRDAYSVGINKYIFLAIMCVCVVSMKTDQLIYLFCFLFPLYVGLPGNYMTLLLLLRLVLGIREFKAPNLFLTVAIAVYMLIQNIVTDQMGIVPMMFIPGIILVLFFFTYKKDLKITPMLLMYAAGVAALGYIMLSSTLQVHNFEDLLSSSFRLGSSSVDYVEEGIMHVSVDPNFYGVFCIASISMAVPFIFRSKTSFGVKICLSCFLALQIIVCLIGLSRSFVIIFLLWILLYLLLQKNIKGAAIASLIIAAIIFALVSFMPEVIETILARFEESDMGTGSGRIPLIQEHFAAWDSSAITVLFGIGLYHCNVHCMPLQFLFGGGVVLFVLMAALFFSYGSTNSGKREFLDFLPLMVTFAMMCTVPAAGQLSYMFPLIWVGLCMQHAKREG